MPAERRTADAVIIGGGFYGAVIAAFLARLHSDWKIILVERNAALMRRASYHNQARVHNGYHYPRSFTTAFRSRVNLPRFVADWSQSVFHDFTKLYAVAKEQSKVSAQQFERACEAVGAQLQPAAPAHRQLFCPRLVEQVFWADEKIFDAERLAAAASADLRACGVTVLTQICAESVHRDGGMHLRCRDASGDTALSLAAPLMFNCTYSHINQLGGDFCGIDVPLKHEITEMALIEVPPPFDSLGITLMDGPFFSCMPFPPRRLHTLSHVRYTPHRSWSDRAEIVPYQQLTQTTRLSRFERMLRDASRFVPGLAAARQVDSLFEVKTVLQQNECDDGRPILLHQEAALPGFFSVLGGKIDNVYDVLELLRQRIAPPARPRRPAAAANPRSLNV